VGQPQPYRGGAGNPEGAQQQESAIGTVVLRASAARAALEADGTLQTKVVCVLAATIWLNAVWKLRKTVQIKICFQFSNGIQPDPGHERYKPWMFLQKQAADTC
jgi:hypothetical protein